MQSGHETGRSVGSERSGDETAGDETAFDETAFDETAFDETAFDETAFDDIPGFDVVDGELLPRATRRHRAAGADAAPRSEGDADG